MLSPSFSQQRFDNIRSDMIRALKNSVTGRPSSQAMHDLTEAVVYGEWGEQALIAAVEKIDLAELEEYIHRFWATATAEAASRPAGPGTGGSRSHCPVRDE